MDPTKFDDFTKAFVTPTSRRQALHRIGGTLTGAILVSLFPGRALADGDDCGDFCDSLFGEGTPEAEKCRKDGKLCSHCDDIEDVCCPSNTSGLCASYSTAICCKRSNQTCVNGACIDPCSGRTCGDLDFGCNGNGSCACYTTIEGVGFCSLPQPCTISIGCTRSTECPFGWACANTCCGSSTVCIQPCRPQASLPSGQTTHGYL